MNQCWNSVQWNLNRNLYSFIQGNAFENVVCETAAILSRPQCVNQPGTESGIFEIITSIQLWTKPCLFASPDHRQQCIWLCKIYGYVYPKQKVFSYSLPLISYWSMIENWQVRYDYPIASKSESQAVRSIDKEQSPNCDKTTYLRAYPMEYTVH